MAVHPDRVPRREVRRAQNHRRDPVVTGSTLIRSGVVPPRR
jgi:hypothetical protein